MQKSLHIDPAKCTGCLQCEMACSYEHTGAINPSKSRIKVFNFEHEGRKVPYTCTQCADAWCMNACPVDAIVIDAATGAKVVREATCVGCKYAPSPARSAPSITWPMSARSRNATSAPAIRSASAPARPRPSRTSMPTGQGSTACAPGPPRPILPLSQRKEERSWDGTVKSCA